MAKTKMKLKDKIYNGIYEDIIKGEYSVDDIITEKELIEKYNVSKSPIREALIELCNDKVLRSIPRKGYHISRIMPKEIVDATEMREIIELKAFDYIKNNLNENIIKKLKEYNLETKRIVDQNDVLKHWHRNIGFHLLLCSFYNNDWMSETLESILNFFTRAAPQYYSKIWEENNEESNFNDNSHHLFIMNLEKRNFDECEEILKKDIELMKNNLFNGG